MITGGIAGVLCRANSSHHQPPHHPQVRWVLVCKRRLSISSDPGDWLTWRMGINERFNPALRRVRREPEVDMFTDATTAQTVDAANRQL